MSQQKEPKLTSTPTDRKMIIKSPPSRRFIGSFFILLAIALHFLATRIFGAEHTGFQNLPNPSLTQLLVTPEKYDGRRIVVQGYFIFEHETSLLYLSREAAEFGLFAEGVWVTVDFEKVEGAAKTGHFAGYVQIVGSFHRPTDGGVGHMGVAAAELRDVTDIMELQRGWPDPTGPPSDRIDRIMPKTSAWWVMLTTGVIGGMIGGFLFSKLGTLRKKDRA